MRRHTLNAVRAKSPVVETVATSPPLPESSEIGQVSSTGIGRDGERRPDRFFTFLSAVE